MGFFSKKDKSGGTKGDEEAAKSALFGDRKASPANGAPSQNPYSAPPPPYQPPSVGGNTYQSTGSSYGTPPATGRSQSTTTLDHNRNELFGSRQPQAPPPQAGGYARSGGYSQTPSASYGASYDKANHQLTAEEEEEEDVEAVKQQIRFTKQESVSSTRNALRIAAQAEETGRNTLGRLATQGERLYNTEKNLDVATAHNRVAEEKARELKAVNGSMFAIHVKNPMKSKSRAQAAEQKILDRHQDEREERERTRQHGYEARDKVGRALNDTNPGRGQRSQMSLSERSKYQFEADESDDEKEREIHSNLDQLSGITSRLKGLAMATGEEVDRQNKQINKIMQKSDNVDDQITITHNRIKRIR